eukprot:SAG31_NODE_4485_length_3196_cov_1.445270_6_plen_90_part_01
MGSQDKRAATVVTTSASIFAVLDKASFRKLVRTDNAWSAMTGQSISERQRMISQLHASSDDARSQTVGRRRTSNSRVAPPVPGKKKSREA